MKSLNLALTEADWSDIGRSVSPDATDSEENVRKAFTALATSVLPFYVRQAKEVTENGFRVAFNADGMLVFYRWLCDYLGMDDALGAVSTIKDVSDMW
ncbi:MAG: hypothetical protein LBP50_03230 [Tannerella sp.]|nr:hypothetical protein [Tannerella sp.]